MRILIFIFVVKINILTVFCQVNDFVITDYSKVVNRDSIMVEIKVFQDELDSNGYIEIKVTNLSKKSKIFFDTTQIYVTHLYGILDSTYHAMYITHKYIEIDINGLMVMNALYPFKYFKLKYPTYEKSTFSNIHDADKYIYNLGYLMADVLEEEFEENYIGKDSFTVSNLFFYYYGIEETISNDPGGFNYINDD